MAQTNETIADIIAEMRGMGNYQRYSGDHARVLAGRLEAALKRERGDCAKLREALQKAAESAVEIMERVRHKDGLAFNTANYIAGIARDALSAPPRNCDVGTAEEQSARFDKFCHANINTQRCCGDCPAFRTTRDDCELVWAQMPYEEGGAK